MADNSIDLVVSKQAFDQLERLLAQIQSADAAITALNTNAGKNPTTPSGGEANAAENAKIIAQMKELNAEIARQAAQIKKLEEAKKSYSRAVTQESVDTTIRNQKARESFKETSKEIDAYQKLDAEYKKAVKSAQALGAQYGANSKQFLTAANAAKELDTKLKAIDGSVGKYGRNVGNYASGWNGLANSVNQLTREAPAFANSLNTGFMALSNNIPILYDEINNLIIKNKELAASGKPTQSVFKSLASSLFSFQTAISVGVTLLTFYGEELVNLALGVNATDKEISKMNKSFADSKNLVTDEMVSVKSLTDIVKDNTQSEANRKSAYDDILEIFPSMIARTYEQAIATGELNAVTDSYIQYLVIQERLKIQIANAARIATMQNERESKTTADLLSWYQKIFIGAAKMVGMKGKAIDIVKESMKADDAALESERKNYDESIKLLLNEANQLEKSFQSKKENRQKEKDQDVLAYEARKAVAQKDIQLNEEKLNNEELFIIERLALLDRDKQLRYNLASIDYNEQIRLAKGNHYKLIKAESDFVKNKSQINEDYNKKQTSLIKAQLTAVEKLAKSVNETDPNKVLAESAKKATKELYAMGVQMDKNNKITKESEQAMLNYARSFMTEFANNSGLTETFMLFTGDGNLFARMSEGMAFTKDSWKNDTLAMMQGVQEMYNFITNASQQNFDAEYARLEAQKEIALQFAGESDSAKKKVEEDAEKRRNEIANRENQAKKKQAIFNIAIDTAQAILSIWAQVPKVDFGISATALSIMVGALGAAQIGAIAAQKIPQYFKGTDNHPGGLALINDGKGANYKETVVTPDGKIRQFSGRDVMIDAPAGTQVFTHDQWNNELNTMMREKGISMSNSFQSKSGLSYAEMDSIIAKHFSKITTQSTVIDRNGFNTFVSNGSSKTIRNQSRYSGTGFSV
jgi:hypothetical protein